MKKTIDNPNIPLNTKVRSVGKKTLNIIFGKTIPQKMFRFYLFAIIIGALLLYAPFSLNNGEYLKYGSDLEVSSGAYTFWDALFISCSAFSDTGLCPTTVIATYNAFGQVVIMLLIQLGGLGLLSIIFLIWNAFRKWNKVDLHQIILLQAERGTTKIGNSYRAIKISIIIIICVEILFAFLMSFVFCFVPAYEQAYQIGDISAISFNDLSKPLQFYGNYGMSLWCGLFTSVSAMNNAGFDIISSSSLAPYRNDYGIFLQAMTMIEFVIGGIGFPVIFDYIEKIKFKRLGIDYKVSLFSKICLWSYLIVAVIGVGMGYMFEYTSGLLSGRNAFQSIVACPNDANGYNPFGNCDQLNRNWLIFYNGMSTRSSGFCTINQQYLSSGTKWTFIIMMFIGASPSSTAGGIRTTTLTIMLATLWCKMMGRPQVSIAKRTIANEQVIDSFLVCIVGIAWVCLTSILVYYSIPNTEARWNISVLDSFYEISSAFGTVGLSAGITGLMSPFGQILTIFTMFIGQLGVTYTILSWTKRKPRKVGISYPTETVKIG